MQKSSAIKVGAAQLPDTQGDLTASLDFIHHLLTLADSKGLSILCFPECFLQGYTLDKATTRERAITLASDQFSQILEQLSQHKAAAIIGLIERDGDDFYNTAVVVHKGELLGKYRKVHLFETNFKPGQEYPVFTVNGLTFGINICYDARFSEGAAELARQGAQVIFYPLNNRLPAEKAEKSKDMHLPNLIARAQETGRWVVSADVVGQDDDTTAYGFTAAVDPLGNVVGRAAELEMDTISFAISK